MATALRSSPDFPEDMSHGSNSKSSTSDPLDLTQDEGWEDVEPDDEPQPVFSLFSNEIFPDVRAMLRDCKKNFHFDLVRVQQQLGLDFLGTVRLVNYIRSEVKAGNSNPNVSSKGLFEDEKYMRPVLEDDALLYSLDDISEDGPPESREEEGTTTPDSSAGKRIRELEEELERVREQFAEYRMVVKRCLDNQLSTLGDGSSHLISNAAQEARARGTSKFREAEEGYFTSYSCSAIHESMLKDTIRTDAYRDFIYDNKHLFKDKVVLDVGCGTGILSMFCAKAGAKLVIAVDNSDIIERAREIVYDNGFGDVIKCLRGKIEEVVLPVAHVDVIVSEWMGYCLLFEAMLDSVIWARDSYLAPGGLMVPSHATLRISPISDPDLVESHISFWDCVYGFKMTPMQLDIHKEALVRSIGPSTVAAESAVFLQLPLHTITIEELTFTNPFKVTLTKDIDVLDGWAVWFDIFFMPSCNSIVSGNALPTDMKKQDFVAFTTGPDGTETHWQQGVFLIHRGKSNGVPLKKGQMIEGSVGYKKKDEKSRLLDIEIGWDAPGVEQGRQEWALQ